MVVGFHSSYAFLENNYEKRNEIEREKNEKE
jgi:hypothetical protein